MKYKVAMSILMALSLTLGISSKTMACGSDAECANDQICNDAGKCVSDGKPNSLVQDFLKENGSLSDRLKITEQFKSTAAAASELCGLKWVRDEGAISVWQAQRRTSVWVNETASYGGVTRILVSMNPGDFLRLKMGRQGLTCA